MIWYTSPAKPAPPWHTTPCAKVLPSGPLITLDPEVSGRWSRLNFRDVYSVISRIKVKSCGRGHRSYCCFVVRSANSERRRPQVFHHVSVMRWCRVKASCWCRFDWTNPRETERRIWGNSERTQFLTTATPLTTWMTFRKGAKPSHGIREHQVTATVPRPVLTVSGRSKHPPRTPTAWCKVLFDANYGQVSELCASSGVSGKPTVYLKVTERSIVTIWRSRHREGSDSGSAGGFEFTFGEATFWEATGVSTSTRTRCTTPKPESEASQAWTVSSQSLKLTSYAGPNSHSPVLKSGCNAAAPCKNPKSDIGVSQYSACLLDCGAWARLVKNCAAWDANVCRQKTGQTQGAHRYAVLQLHRYEASEAAPTTSEWDMAAKLSM